MANIQMVGNVVDKAFYSDKGEVSFASIRLASNNFHKENGEYVNDPTLFVTVKAFGKKADMLKKAQKGTAMAVTGKLTVVEYESKTGAKGTDLVVIADTLAEIIK